MGICRICLCYMGKRLADDRTGRISIRVVSIIFHMGWFVNLETEMVRK